MRATALIAFLAAFLLAGCVHRPPQPGGVRTGVAFDRAGEIGGFAEGIADPAAGRAATLDDPVRIASVSKLVVAIGAMKLVEQGRLPLDSDISPLLGWPVRNPAHPDAPITLSHLLTHSSGLRDHQDQYAVPLGETLAGAVLAPESWDGRHAPGTFFTYSNLNTPLVAALMERVTGERFDRWMRREVLEPLGVDACFNWPTCSPEAIARAVVLTQGGAVIRDDLGGRQPACPVFVRAGRPCDLALWRAGENGALFSPQGGLRISARGLARIGRMLLGEGSLEGVRLLDPASVRTLLAPRWQSDGRNGETDGGFTCLMGPGTHRLASGLPSCRDDPLGNGGSWVGHAGSAYGVRSGLWIDPARGTGIAYFATGLDALPAAGRSAFRAPEEALFRRSAALLGKRAGR